ncbi:MAG: pyridoxine 5'-phosphate synthase [bacterium]
MTTIQQRLYINIDHIATIRQARRGDEPVPVDAVSVCERAGAHGITAHLREDRRHMQDADIHAIAEVVSTVFNLEIAGTDEMIALAERVRPYQVTIVPERREEVTTEGGLNVAADPSRLARSLERLRSAGIRTSLFIDADRESVTRSRDLGADSIELHTGRYAHASSDPATLAALRDGAALGASLGLAVHAGHGLTTTNVGAVAAIMEIEELNIGHHVVSRAVFVGLETAIRELRTAMDAARRVP